MDKEQPQPNITDPAFEWRNSAQTDVQATWRKYGWVAPSERRKQDAEQKPEPKAA